MMKKLCRNITILILAAAITAACANILEPPAVNRDEGTGTVYIVIEGAGAGERTLAPAPGNFSRYTASFSGPASQADLDLSGGSGSVNLAPGSWTLTVTAYTGADPAYTAVGRGSATVSVVSGQTANADITITPIPGSGPGSLSYSVTLPAVDNASLSLTNMETATAVSGMPIDLKAAAGGGAGTVSAVLGNLNAGYYLLNIHLEQAGKYAGRTEVVHIYQGLETSAEYGFSEADFMAVVALTGGVWEDGNMAVSGQQYYRFAVTQGRSYAVYWNDYYGGDGTKTLDIRMSAYYESTGTSIFSNADSGYNTPQSFTALSGDTVILRAAPYSSGGTGTYAVLYGEVMPLTDGTAAAGTIAAGGIKLYSFSAAANTAYTVSWEDAADQAGSSYTGDIQVTAYRGSIGSNLLFNNADSGYSAPQMVSYSSAATIYLKVAGKTGAGGTYSVMYQQQ
jgi:hypothetical protein